jgi:hypothetical protein
VALRPKPRCRPGATPMGRPSTNGRSSGVNLHSTSHRPSSPRGWRAMPRYRPGLELPRSVPVTTADTRSGRAGPDDDHREEVPRRTEGSLLGEPPFARKPPQLDSRPTGEPVGSLTSHVPVEQLPGEPVGSSATTGGSRPCTDSADASWTGHRAPASARRPPPDLASDPGLRCALRYDAHLVDRIAPGQGLFLNSQGCPRNFPVTHRFGAFIHRSYTAIPTVRHVFSARSHVGHAVHVDTAVVGPIECPP